jgi:hypothetical protein
LVDVVVFQLNERKEEMEPLPIFLAVAGLIVGFALATMRASWATKPKRRNWLLVWDGQLATIVEVQQDTSGVKVTTDSDIGSEYLIPEGFVVRTLRMDDLQTIRVAGIDRLALMQHAELDKYRQAVLARSVPAYKPGGDSMGMVRMVAVALPIMLSLFLVLQLQGLQEQLTSLAASSNTLSVLIEDGIRIQEVPLSTPEVLP